MFKKLFTFKNIIFTTLIITILLIVPKIVNIVLLFFAAYVLACALSPYVAKLENHVNRSIASLIAVLLSCVAIFTLFIPILIMTFKEVANFLYNLPQRISELAAFANSTTVFGKKLSMLITPENFIPKSVDFTSNLVGQSWSFTLGVFEVAIISVALMMIVYYLLVDENYLKNKLLEFFPADLKEKADGIIKIISSKVGGYVSAQILSMIAVGLMTMIVMLILGIDYALLLGLIAGVLDIIPIAGPSIALGIILLVASPIGWVKAIVIIAMFLLVQQISNYIVRPILFGKWMQLHPLMIFLALFLAQQFLGFWGVILSPAIAATICVLIDELYLKPINEKNENLDE